MNYRMIMTSGYPEMTRMIQKIADELGFAVTVVEGILLEAAQEVKNLVSKGGYEVVISRAGTAKTISELIDIPVVYSDTSDFDLLQAFIRAKEFGDKIGYLAYFEKGFPFNLDKIQETLGFDVTIFPYEKWDDLIEQVKKAKTLGMDVLVGGGIRASEIIKNHGMRSMYITTSERTIKRTLIRASQLVQNRILIKEKAERLNAVINVSEEGILFLNKEGQIESFNPAAEKMFGIKEYMVLGKKHHELMNRQLVQLLKHDKVYSGKGDFILENMVVTHEPVIVGDDQMGIVITCREFSKIQQLESQIRRELHSKGLVARITLSDICHTSEKMSEVLKLANEYAKADSTVLVMGESGTGKELIAQGIHNASNRKDGPFVAVNCAALPESLLESELFGYADGAFTGAKKGGRAGVFELAHDGTIFLDEIGEITPNIQARLLRVLQEKEVMRVGGDRIIPVDIRIVAATNQKLWKLVKEGKFRADLYFRLGVLRLELPPLHQRREDLPTLVDHLLARIKSSLNWNDFSEKLQQFFMAYNWPGNVRQLENVVERLHLWLQHSKDEDAFIKDVLRETEDEQDSLVVLHNDDSLVIRYGTIDEIEKQVITHMLERFDNNRTLVAEKLGMSRTTLWKKLSNEN
ncbi:sigma 54-interacting transcriptional regulator [Ammoniphilus sp. 3BR4]|uniref:sigma 54-interacting transcriptional regulator n=1 Tax=Ammoniphilus sp. 3BR4 TaxID=3158265 RepID=UPI0034670C74